MCGSRRAVSGSASNHERRHRELQEAVEYMNSKQGRLLAATEHKQQLMSQASEEIHVLVLEDRISAAEIEFLETCKEMREPMWKK